MIETYTDAPECYDGFGSHTVRVLGTSGSKTVRLVRTPAEHHEWQITRYMSGCCLAASAETWPKIKHLYPGIEE